MLWYALRPRDPADPRWPLPGSPVVNLKADNADEARAKFAQAYPSEPFGTPTSPVADAGQVGFAHDAEALLVEETSAPPSPPK
ncbi:hypothetical protein G3T14_07475 [Methylobacterium sp. BTF04]|uniref:hypothetical protein n=1 Tax=Methylobacterium sp. BTF04 TaxID=2708300 RepID=UPI0013D0028F|nr:hypothetical protein [Methylobacterium sp. BTF04]NEU11968.1 hypothetical protein [Methylobacterium sp. BTF04]